MTPKSRADAARQFPTNTCAASRHAQLLAEDMIHDEFYDLDGKDAIEAGESILSIVASLWEARARIAEQDELLNAIRDLFPRSSPSKPLPDVVAARVKEMEADAERYRHMRNNAQFQNRNGPGLCWYLPRNLHGTAGEQLDAAVDAARWGK